jgi:hypothetical protein
MDKRRFLSKCYFVLLTCLLILPCSKDANGAVWKWYGKGAHGTFYFYDVESINYLPQNFVRVFVKSIPGDEASREREIAEWRKTIPTIPDNWSYTIYLYEVNCKDRTFKALQGTAYNTKDEVIISSIAIEDSNHIHITPESMMEKLSGTVCVK